MTEIKWRTPTYADSSGTRMTERLMVAGPDEVRLGVVLDTLWPALPSGMALADVKVHSAFMSWERPATEEEQQKHREYTEHHTARLMAWERETYIRLKHKFEGSDDDPVEVIGEVRPKDFSA